MTHPLIRQGKEALRLLRELILPRACCNCGFRLMADEEMICHKCLEELPRTNLKGKKNNIVERLLWDDLITTQRANSLLYYRKEKFETIYYDFKYHNRPDVAVFFGKMMANDLTGTDFFEGIDRIIPVPLNKKKMKQRGYNQSERLAEGVRAVTGIPVDTLSVIRHRDTSSQTRVTNVEEREANVKESFSVVHPECLNGRHLLLIDDVLTTGSTIRALARAILTAAPEAKISLLTLGLSSFHQHGLVPPYAEEHKEHVSLKKTRHRQTLPF